MKRSNHMLNKTAEFALGKPEHILENLKAIAEKRIENFTKTSSDYPRKISRNNEFIMAVFIIDMNHKFVKYLKDNKIGKNATGPDSGEQTHALTYNDVVPKDHPHYDTDDEILQEYCMIGITKELAEVYKIKLD